MKEWRCFGMPIVAVLLIQLAHMTNRQRGRFNPQQVDQCLGTLAPTKETCGLSSVLQAQSLLIFVTFRYFREFDSARA
jgi:hypothetical protein